MKHERPLRKMAVKIDEVVSSSAPTFFAGSLERILKRRRVSYSSFAEDLIIENIFSRHFFSTGQKLNYSYVDIGAWRPIRGSNTYKSYRKGIRGTAVEPNPFLFKLWRAVRPGDNFLPFACSLSKDLEFLQFTNMAPSNTANIDFAKEISKTQAINPRRKIKVNGMTLNEIISNHLKFFPGKFILDLDIEGDDAQVLENFNFVGDNRPIVILVEDHFKSRLLESPVSKLLIRNNYTMVSRSIITSFFVDAKSELALTQYAI